MKQLDVYYRALLAYREFTAKDRECAALRKQTSQANAKADRLTVKRTVCTVDEEWVETIERGLVFIEKAIKEERQFIYTTGEVEPIEKVKHVSKDSVDHLSKHSNLITREQTGKEIIPDKLYSVERLNDYAVYENRFLYMLLCLLRDFVNVRYAKILELTNKYDGFLHIEKDVKCGDRHLEYKIDVTDEIRNDRYLVSLNTAKDIVDRIELIQKTIVVFLATPLMESAGKASMLKPPITKTNVLKMDNNFKEAVALYEYIIAYDKDGYTAEDRVTELGPFRAELADQMSEACGLLSFLTYEYGLGIEPMLKLAYDQEEQRKKDAEKAQKTKLLTALKRKLNAAKLTPEEYIFALEKQVKYLKGEGARLEPLRMELSKYKEDTVALNMHISNLKEELKIAEQTFAEAEKHHTEELDNVRAEWNGRMMSAAEKHREDMESLSESYNGRMAEMSAEMLDIVNGRKDEIAELRAQLIASRSELERAESENRKLREETLIAQARLTAQRIDNGELADEDFTEKESFDRLETEFEAFKKFYKTNWGKTKRKIRKSILNLEYLKNHNGKEDSQE